MTRTKLISAKVSFRISLQELLTQEETRASNWKKYSYEEEVVLLSSSAVDGQDLRSGNLGSG